MFAQQFNNIRETSVGHSSSLIESSILTLVSMGQIIESLIHCKNMYVISLINIFLSSKQSIITIETKGYQKKKKKNDHNV